MSSAIFQFVKVAACNEEIIVKDLRVEVKLLLDVLSNRRDHFLLYGRRAGKSPDQPVPNVNNSVYFHAT